MEVQGAVHLLDSFCTGLDLWGKAHTRPGQCTQHAVVGGVCMRATRPWLRGTSHCQGSPRAGYMAHNDVNCVCISHGSRDVGI